MSTNQAAVAAKKGYSTKELVLDAMFIALTYVFTAFVNVRLPIAVACVIKVVGYYIAEVIIYHNVFAPVASIPGNLVQIGTAAVIVMICIEPLRKILRPVLK